MNLNNIFTTGIVLSGAVALVDCAYQNLGSIEDSSALKALTVTVGIAGPLFFDYFRKRPSLALAREAIAYAENEIIRIQNSVAKARALIPEERDSLLDIATRAEAILKQAEKREIQIGVSIENLPIAAAREKLETAITEVEKSFDQVKNGITKHENAVIQAPARIAEVEEGIRQVTDKIRGVRDAMAGFRDGEFSRPAGRFMFGRRAAMSRSLIETLRKETAMEINCDKILEGRKEIIEGLAAVKSACGAILVDSRRS